MTRAIMSINEPIMTISTKTKDGNPAVIMMLPEYGNNDAPLYAVLSFIRGKQSLQKTEKCDHTLS